MPKGKTTPENTWQRIEYWIKRNPGKTREECEEMLREKLLGRKQSNPNNIEYWIKLNPDKTREECEGLLDKYKRENNYQCIEYWIKRNPDKTREECEEMMEARIRTGIDKRPDNSGTNNPNHRSNTTSKQRRSNSAMCIEFYEKKYPNATHEEHLEMLAEHKAKIKDILQDKTKQPKCVEHWTVQGYTEEEARQIISESQRTFSLEKCIAKYGEEEGRRIFKERQEKWQKTLKETLAKNGDGRSPQSMFAHELIGDICLALDIDIPKREKYITDTNTCRSYAYDFTFGKKIIEFNGDYWHCYPGKYDASYWCAGKKKFAEEVWVYDKQKILCANRHGYDVLVVWEHEYIEDYDKTLKKCIDFLKGTYNLKD